MAVNITIPDGILTPSEEKDLVQAVDRTIAIGQQTGSMNLARFMQIIKDACYRIWYKISGFFSDLWDEVCDLFS
jgi:hypothetical protein